MTELPNITPNASRQLANIGLTLNGNSCTNDQKVSKVTARKLSLNQNSISDV